MIKKILNLKSCFLNLKSSVVFSVRKKNAGFTLIETFIAITILLIAMTGPLSLVNKALSISKMAKGQVTAMYLAQEAVEYIRNVRDGNILNGNNWLVGLEDCINQKCTIDSPKQEIDSCGETCKNLKYDSDKYLYTYESGNESRFRRDIEINIKEISNNKEMKIIVNMYWADGPNNREFTVSERLLNWQ